MKFSIEEVVDAMKEVKVNSDVIDSTLKKLAELEDELKKNKEPTTRSKKKFIIISSSGDVKISETPMWIAQIEEDDDHNEIVNNIKRSLKTYNATARKPINVETLGEAIRDLPKKALSAFGVFLKTKEPVIIVETNNSL